jgi:signal transduction histidine kinase
MRIDVVLLGLFAAAASAVALLSWRRSRKSGCRLADLAAQYEKAESDKGDLIHKLSVRNHEEDERILRLEHDVKSSLGVVLGFSALLRESMERDPGTPPLALKNINAIHQAATKIMQTIDAAVKGRNSRPEPEIVLKGRN